MDARLITLKLFLDELHIPTEIDTVDDRKRAQKAVYLGQLTGVDLSYRFGWYLMGPYSPALTKDYYNLAEAIASGDKDYETQRLQPSIQERLHKALPLTQIPQDVALTTEQWLELLASYHYLRNISKQDDEQAVKTLQATKPTLVEYTGQAKKALNEAGFLA